MLFGSLWLGRKGDKRKGWKFWSLHCGAMACLHGGERGRGGLSTCVPLKANFLLHPFGMFLLEGCLQKKITCILDSFFIIKMPVLV